MPETAACPACHSTETISLRHLKGSDIANGLQLAPPRKRTSPRVKLVYATVLVTSWSIVPVSAFYFVSVSYIRYHLEMPWILRFTDMELSIPAIVIIVGLIAFLRFLWVRCTNVIHEETRWNADEYPKLLAAWERTLLCSKCNHRWTQ
ncbi:hypothetical protein IT570_10090 [Candidatus Sumerlaeota bacterium]|nr:hypothetical protein [Candidatus Sumerlaeota bacterium]